MSMVIGSVYVEGITKTFRNGGEEHCVLQNVSFTIRPNEFLVLFGPGQCGKSVLMEIIAGLIPPTSGRIVGEDGRALRQEDISMVFQKYALLPWRTCLENVALPMKFQGVSRAERERRAREYLKLVDLEGFESKYPRQISGGMKQRVAIARSYAKDCGLLLFDEPFGALDAQTRYFMECELERIWEKKKKTVVFITNNIEEALYLGDRIIILGGNPATVAAEYQVGFKRPRNHSDPEFLKLRAEIADHSAITRDAPAKAGGGMDGQ